MNMMWNGGIEIFKFIDFLFMPLYNIQPYCLCVRVLFGEDNLCTRDMYPVNIRIFIVNICHVLVQKYLQ